MPNSSAEDGQGAQSLGLNDASDGDIDEPDQSPQAVEVAEPGAKGDVDESDGPDSDDEPVDSPASRTWSRRPSRPVMRLIAAVISGAILAGTAWLGWLWKDQHDNEIAAGQALAAAQQFAGVLTNFDAARIDDNFHATIDGSTGEFKDMFVKSSAQLRLTLVENKAVAHGVVVESAVEWASKDTVRVLLFIDQSVSNAGSPDPRIDRSRVKMTMQKIDGRWLASKVELP